VYYHSNGILREVIDALSNGVFSHGDGAIFQPLIRSLLDRDEYMLFADFQPYVDCQARVSEAYLDVDRWSRMSILNTARSGKFSSDRAIREYSRLIWNVDGFREPAMQT
jgi:glycogen phosphorylase